MKREARKTAAIPIRKEPEKKPPIRHPGPFEEMDRMFEQILPRGWLMPFRWESPWLAELGLPFEGKLPKIDVIDRDAEVLVRAQVPGVKKEDLEVSITGDTVTIKGQTAREEKEEKGEYFRCEISRGAFTRTIRLPAAVKSEGALTEFKEGVLEIKLPKAEQAQRRLLKVA